MKGVTHTHKFSYKAGSGANADTITATCTGEFDCPYKTESGSITIKLEKPTNLSWDGNTKAAKISGYPASFVENLAAKPQIFYYMSTGSGSTTIQGGALAGAPKDAGNYIAKITWGGVSVSAAFTITKTSEPDNSNNGQNNGNSGGQSGNDNGGQPGTNTGDQTYITAEEKAAAKISLDLGLKGSSKGGKITAKWGSVPTAKSFDVFAAYCDKGGFEKIATLGGDKRKTTITWLKGKKLDKKRNVKYYVVAYRDIGELRLLLAKSQTIYVAGSASDKYSNVKSIKVKKKSYKLKKGKKEKIKAKIVLQKKDKKPLPYGPKFRYASSNSKIANVSKKGKITAVGKGKCNVYVYARNGCTRKLSVVVN